MSKADLRIDWATHAAAKYACENWHYSGCVPKSKLAKLGVWEFGQFKGVVMFGVGATSSLVQSYGLLPSQGCELVRIALKKHETPVSRIVAVSLKMLKAKFNGLRLIVSFADSEQGHHGGIYQAGGWIYSGMSKSAAAYIINGKRLHGRVVHLKYGTKVPFADRKVPGSAKHRYLMPLDAEMRARIMPLAKPYPKRAKQAMTGDQSAQRQGSTDPHAPQIEQTA